MDLAGHKISFRKLPIKERYILGIEMGQALGGKQVDFTLLADPQAADMIERLIALSDAPDEVFDDDLNNQFVVAFAAEHNLEGLFDPSDRMLIHESRHRAIRKAFSKDEATDAEKIGPTIKQYWFLYRPVMADLCSYEAMFLDERFSFRDIHEMHEMLDVKQFHEIVANHVEV